MPISAGAAGSCDQASEVRTLMMNVSEHKEQ